MVLVTMLVIRTSLQGRLDMGSWVDIQLGRIEVMVSKVTGKHRPRSRSAQQRKTDCEPKKLTCHGKER